jgi:hypothetical protein
MSENQDTKTRKELINLLDNLNIEDFMINTKEKQLLIYYKEDFDNFFSKLNANPRVLDDKDKTLPYGATHFASFEYHDWFIKGNILANKKSNKPNLSAKTYESERDDPKMKSYFGLLDKQQKDDITDDQTD